MTALVRQGPWMKGVNRSLAGSVALAVLASLALIGCAGSARGPGEPGTSLTTGTASGEFTYEVYEPRGAEGPTTARDHAAPDPAPAADPAIAATVARAAADLAVREQSEFVEEGRPTGVWWVADEDVPVCTAHARYLASRSVALDAIADAREEIATVAAAESSARLRREREEAARRDAVDRARAEGRFPPPFDYRREEILAARRDAYRERREAAEARIEAITAAWAEYEADHAAAEAEYATVFARQEAERSERAVARAEGEVEAEAEAEAEAARRASLSDADRAREDRAAAAEARRVAAAHAREDAAAAAADEARWAAEEEERLRAEAEAERERYRAEAEERERAERGPFDGARGERDPAGAAARVAAWRASVAARGVETETEFICDEDDCLGGAGRWSVGTCERAERRDATCPSEFFEEMARRIDNAFPDDPETFFAEEIPSSLRSAYRTWLRAATNAATAHTRSIETPTPRARSRWETARAAYESATEVFDSARFELPRVRGDDPDVRGAISREVVRSVVESHLSDIRECYRTGLAEEPTLSGRMTISFIVSAIGTVATAHVPTSTLANDIIDACVVDAVRGWLFPVPDTGGVTGVNYPFDFDTDG